MTYWQSCPTVYGPSSDAAESGCRWVSDNASAWPVRSGRRRRCCCSTSQPLTWMLRPKLECCRPLSERARTGDTVVIVGHREQVVGIGDHVVEVAGAGDVHHAGV